MSHPSFGVFDPSVGPHNEFDSVPTVSPLPTFLSGRLGSLFHYHMSEAFDRLNELDDQAHTKNDFRTLGRHDRDRTERSKPHLFTAEITDSKEEPFPNPLGRILAWREVLYHIDDLFVPAAGRSSLKEGEEAGPTPPDEFAYPARIVAPPFGVLRAQHDNEGEPRFFWMPGTMAYSCKVESVSGVPPNHTYEIKTSDKSVLESGLTPVDRWDTIEYTARNMGDVLMLMVTSDTDFHLFAFETPMFDMCPAGASNGVVEGADIGMLGL